MGRTKTLPRLERLDELIGLLKSQDTFIVSELADRLLISDRTLMRDLDILKQKGYPIESERGRGGGIRLNNHWGIGRLLLNYHEIIDLLLSLAIMEKIGSPLFLGNLTAIRNKITVSFPQEQRVKIQSIRKRILIGGLASEHLLNNHQATPKILSNPLYESFFEMKNLDITYEDGEGCMTNREIEPHYLFLNWPIWYVLAWDYLRNDVRCFRLDRVHHASTKNIPFKLKNDAMFTKDIKDFSSVL